MKKYAVFGNPIKHSMSPLIHSYFAKSLNIELSYEPILGSLDKFEIGAEKFLKNGGLGFNITLPFKQDAFNFAEIKSDIAMITGSVNTISLKGGVIHGDNTDGSGFTKDLKNNIKYEVANKKILILGAGGAAMGVIPNVLSEEPSELKICNRTFSKAQILSKKFSSFGDVDAITIDSQKKLQFDLIINATSIGINNLKFDLPNNFFKKETVCYDMSYGKAANSFMNWAKKNNLKFYNGLGMLLEQAADSFYIWEQKRPLITDELRSILNKQL